MNLDRLKQFLHYCPETGVFTWLKSRPGPGARAGQPAGRLSLGYVVIKFDQIEYQAHRLAWFYMTGLWPEDQIDHRDLCRSNNRWDNLRPATNKQNHENLPMLCTNTSGHRGVRWDQQRRKWFAFITHNQRMKNLGRFARLDEAVAARAAAERIMFTHSAACTSL